ncbi:MAG: hypothetical protein IJY61_08070 [Candidatus Gastranaerophilales bacterium]|nr:hypothetical protein [Candidatus Gastranaerophilales bacterium]
MKIKSILLCFILLLTGLMSAEATQLPKEVKSFLQTQKNVPSVRFDGIVVYNSDVMYLPIIPAYPKDVEKLNIIKTYPENQSMDNLPDMVLFNNNYALLKVIRTGENTLSIRDIPNMPVEIKTGTLPQDIVVPRGLVLPETYAGILGDVKVPLIGSAKTSTFVTTRKSAPLPSGKRIADTEKYTIPNALKDKLYFVNNFQTEYLQVYSSSISEPLYSLKTSGVMKDVKPAVGGKYLLAATQGKKNIDVIDVINEYVAKTIDLTAVPSEIVVDDSRGKAYVASAQEEALFVIDLSTMSIKEKIQLVGAPQRLSVSKDGNKIAYVDIKTSNIYVLDLANEYANKLVTKYPNATKLIINSNKLYLISRINPQLRIVYFDLYQDTEITKTKKDKKREQQRKEENKKQNVDSITEDIYSADFDDFDAENMETADSLLKDVKTYSTSIKDINIGKKPIDLYLRDENLYVLCAGDNTVYSYNVNNDKLTSEELPVGGFSKAFSPVPNSNLAVITNMADLKYVVYDMDRNKAIQTLPINEYINTITILERSNGK